MGEFWKEIKGYEGYYEISNLGEVRSKDRIVKSCHNSTQKIKGKIIAKCINSSGYEYVRLNKNGKSKMYFVHRLVAIAFIPNPKNLPLVNHKNECKTCNNVENLEWCTNSYNQKYGSTTKRKVEKLGKKVKCIELNITFNGMREAEREMLKKFKIKVYKAGIAKCCDGIYSHHGKTNDGLKLHWKYASDNCG